MFSPIKLNTIKKRLLFSEIDKHKKNDLIKTPKLIRNGFKKSLSNMKDNYNLTSFSFINNNITDKVNITIKPYNTILEDKNKKIFKIKEQNDNNLYYSKIFLKNYGDMEDEKIKLKKILNDLISWENNNNKLKEQIEDFDSNKNIRDTSKKIKRIKFSKSELISFIKNNDDSVRQDTMDILKNEREMKLLKLKFSVFDKDFNSNKYKEQEKTIKEGISIRNKELEFSKLILDKNFYKQHEREQKQNELKERESIMFIYKKIVMNKLKKKKYLELLDDTYRLLEKARVEHHLSIDILNERSKSVQKYYFAYINIFKEKMIKLNQKNIRRRKSMSYIETDENDNNHKNERNLSQEITKLKSRHSIIEYEEKLKKYREYLSICDDINIEINNYNKKFNSIQKDLNCILEKVTKKVEEINKDSNKLKVVFKELNQKQTKYYLNILKKGIDTRMEGLSWVVKRLIELNVPIDSTIFPGFLDQEQIDYIIQISKYGYEINQLKIILDTLRERQNELSEEKIKYNNKKFYDINNKNKTYLNTSFKNNNIKEHLFNDIYYEKKLMMKYRQSKALVSNYSKIINNENVKMEIENNIINLMLKNLKNQMGLYARDNSFDIKDKRDIKNNIFKFILSNDNQKEYFHDVFILIERIRKLNNLIKDLQNEELLIFGEKFKFVDLKDETTKTFYGQVFNALFGNTVFKSNEFKNKK